MPKNKNHKGLAKRMRISKTGKIRHRSANHKHLRSGKGGKRLRQLRKDPYMSSADAKRLEKLLFRRLRGRNDPKAALRRSPSPAERAAAKAEKAAAMATATSATATATRTTKAAAPKSAPKAGAKTAAKTAAKKS
jgi:large subunit ribosomal protein L35